MRMSYRSLRPFPAPAFGFPLQYGESGRKAVPAIEIDHLFVARGYEDTDGFAGLFVQPVQGSGQEPLSQSPSPLLRVYEEGIHLS